MVLASPLFLIGLLAVGIPVAVHLFNFRRYRKVYFSNVEMLEQLQSETRRQSTLRRLLVLIARILAIVFLVLAFARPVLPGSGGYTKTGSNDVSIYIDNSYSMENTDGNMALLDKAKAKAREIVAAYGPSDRFQLLTNDMEGRHFHWLSKDEMLLMIDEVESGGAAATVSSMTDKMSSFLHGGTGDNKYAYLISDFQVSAADFSEVTVDSSVVFTLVPLESVDCDNIFVDSIAFNAPVYYRGGSVTVKAWIRNEGDEDMEKVPVSLFVNDRQRAMATVDIAARSASIADLHFVIDESGTLACRIETSDYPITFDDKYYFTLNVRDRIHGLIVEGGAGNEYLARLFEGDSTVAVETMDLKRMDFSRIGDADFVILDELSTITTGMAQTMKGFVEAGGTLVIVPSAGGDVAGYNAALSLFSAPRLGNVHQGRVSGGRVDFDNPLYLNVFKDRDSEMELPTVSRYYRLESAGATLRQSVINLANGDDYLTTTPCGLGSLYLFASPLRDANTDFVRQALFVPTLYNMALYSIPMTTTSATLGSETPLPLSGLYDQDAVVNLRNGDGSYEEIPDIRIINGRKYLIQHGSLRESGNYSLSQSGKIVEGVSFNYPRLESRLEFLSNDNLQQLLKDYNLSNFNIVKNPEKPLDSYLKEKMEGRSLWRLCLILALAMILVEIVLVRIPEKKR